MVGRDRPSVAQSCGRVAGPSAKRVRNTALALAVKPFRGVGPAALTHDPYKVKSIDNLVPISTRSAAAGQTALPPAWARCRSASRRLHVKPYHPTIGPP